MPNFSMGAKYSTHCLQYFWKLITMNMNTNKCKFITRYKCVGHNYVEKISHNICFSMSAHSICTGNSSKIKTSPLKIWLKRILLHYETEEMGFRGEPIWVRTLSSHWRGPWRWISIQHGVLVTSWRWYSAPQPWKGTDNKGNPSCWTVNSLHQL